MINVFVLQNGRLNQVPIDSREDLEQVAPVWIARDGDQIVLDFPAVPATQVAPSSDVLAALAGAVPFWTGVTEHADPGERNMLAVLDSEQAVRELTPTLAAHLIARGVTVDCVNPGPNNTGYADEAAWARVAERNPGGRASTPQDTARLVGWLVSDEAEWVTAQVIASDGGWSSLGA